MKKLCCLLFFFGLILNVLAKDVMEAQYLKISELQTSIENNNITVFVPVNYKNVKIYNYQYFLSGKRVAKTNQNSYTYQNLKKGRRYLIKVLVVTSEGIKTLDKTIFLKEPEEPDIKIKEADTWSVKKEVSITFFKNTINTLEIKQGMALLKQGILETKTSGNVLQTDTIYPVITRKIILEVYKPTIIQIKENKKNRYYNIQIDKIDTDKPSITPKEGVFQLSYQTSTNPSNYFLIKWGKSGVGKINCNPSNTNVLDYGKQEITCTVISKNGQTSRASKEIIIKY